MKIYCNIDSDKRKFEGRTFLAGTLVNFLKQNGFEFTSKPEEADLFHFHSSGISDSYKIYKLKKKFNKPAIYSMYSNCKTEFFHHPINFLIQGINFQKTATKFLPSYTAVIPLKWRGHYLKKLDKVIVPSEYLRRHLFDNTEIIHFGIDTEKFVPVKKSATENIKVAYFGHPGVFKGMNDFISASKQFNPKIETHLFLTERFEKVDKYIIKNNPKAIIHGFVEDVVSSYNEIDIIVLPYRTKIGTVANPLVLLEAMSCGKAIITTDFTFIKEIVQDAAVLVKPYSPKELAKAVNDLAEEPEKCSQLGQKARQKVIDNYNLNSMLENYLSLYNNL